MPTGKKPTGKKPTAKSNKLKYTEGDATMPKEKSRRQKQLK